MNMQGDMCSQKTPCIRPQKHRPHWNLDKGNLTNAENMNFSEVGQHVWLWKNNGIISKTLTPSASLALKYSPYYILDSHVYLSSLLNIDDILWITGSELKKKKKNSILPFSKHRCIGFVFKMLLMLVPLLNWKWAFSARLETHETCCKTDHVHACKH